MNRENTGFENKRTSFKDEFCVWSGGGKAALEYDVGEEYLLPDYLPDIRKILLVKTAISENDSFIRDGKAEYSGEIVFRVFYLGDNGQIKCVTQGYPYTNYVALDTVFEDSVINAETSVKNRSVRAVSPRKLLLKAKVLTELSVYNKLCVSPRLTGGTGLEDEFTLERKTEKVDSINYLQFEESDIRISEDMEYKGKNPISELVAYDAELFMTDCEYTDGRLVIKGNARIFVCLGFGDDEEGRSYEVVERNVPIEHVVETKLGEAWSTFYGDFELGAMECGIANDSYGESRIIEIDFVCRACITAVSNEKTYFTDDVFSTAYEYENTYKNAESQKLIKGGFANISASGSSEIPNSENIEFERILMSQQEVEMSLSKVSGGKAVFEGECIIKVIVSDKSNGFTNAEVTFPVRYETPVDDIERYGGMVRSSVLDSRISLDGNKINANVEIGINYVVTEDTVSKCVSQISIDKSRPIEHQREKVMMLYYPEKYETLWSIAKKYKVSCADLENANNRKLTEALPRVMIIPEYKKS